MDTNVTIHAPDALDIIDVAEYLGGFPYQATGGSHALASALAQWLLDVARNPFFVPDQIPPPLPARAFERTATLALRIKTETR